MSKARLEEKSYYIFTDNERIVGDNDSMTLRAHPSHASAGEYLLKYEEGEYFSLRCLKTGKYVSAASFGHVTANRDERKESELFKFDGTDDTWGKIVCKDGEPWYTKIDGDEAYIHHKDRQGLYLFVPCDMAVTERRLELVASADNTSPEMGKLTRSYSLTVGFSSSISKTKSLKVVAGFLIESVFKLDIESTKSCTRTKTSTESSTETITVEVSVSPGGFVQIYQQVAYAPAGFRFRTGHYKITGPEGPAVLVTFPHDQQQQGHSLISQKVQ